VLHHYKLPLGCFCSIVARSRCNGRPAELQFSPSRSRQGICPQIAALSALTSPCSTSISVGSVRELPEATKVELCLLNTAAAVFICGGASAVSTFVAWNACIQRPLSLEGSSLNKYIQPLQLCRCRSYVKEQCLEQMVAEVLFRHPIVGLPTPCRSSSC
jgi:hypothetical protein